MSLQCLHEIAQAPDRAPRDRAPPGASSKCLTSRPQTQRADSSLPAQVANARRPQRRRRPRPLATPSGGVVNSHCARTAPLDFCKIDLPVCNGAGFGRARDAHSSFRRSPDTERCSVIPRFTAPGAKRDRRGAGLTDILVFRLNLPLPQSHLLQVGLSGDFLR